MVLILEWYLYKVKLFKMKIFKKITSILITLIVMINFSSCAGTYKLEKSVRLTIGEVYYQNWVAGVQGGGAGFNIFIPVSDNPKNIMFDSVYFKGKKAKLEFSNNTIFIGRFKTTKNRIRDINMISDSNDGFSEKIPFLEKELIEQLRNVVVDFQEFDLNISAVEIVHHTRIVRVS